MSERAAWEQEVARKHSLSRSRDRGFFETVWRDADENEDPPRNLEEFEAFAEYRLRYYAMPTPGDSSASIAGNMKDMLNGGGSSGGGDRDTDSAVLDESTAARALAWAEYLAAIASVDEHVMRLRERICGGPTDTFSPESALAFLEADSVQGGKVIMGAPSTLLWPDGSRHGRGFRFEEGSMLAELKQAGGRLANHYPWKDYQAAHFILCGGVPQAMVIGAGHKSGWGEGPHAHRFNQTTITLEVAAWMPSEYVRQAYCKARENLEDGNRGTWGIAGARQSPKLRSTEVFRFVMSQAYVHFRSKEECKARLGLPSWAQLVKDWNAKFPKDDPRRMEAKYFRRVFERAQLAIVDRDEGLPGTPGQPVTREESPQMEQRLKESNQRMLERLQRERESKE